MPHIHERAFVVRHYECDAYGRQPRQLFALYAGSGVFGVSRSRV